MNAKQFLKANPQQYVLVTTEFGYPLYIAPSDLSGVNATDIEAEAEKWSALDNSPTKLAYFKAVTGYKGLHFQEVKPAVAETTKPVLSKEELCQMFGCSMDRLNAQYAANATQLQGMAATARKKGPGKKYNGQTAEEWEQDALRIQGIAAQ